MLKKIIFSGIVSLLWVSSVLAGGAVVKTQKIAKTHGFYFGAQAGYSTVNYQNSSLKSGYRARSIDNSGLAPHLYIGYVFDRYIASEFGVIYVDRPSFEGITYTPSNTITHIKNNIVYLDLRLGIPIWRFNVYIKGGIGYIVRDGIIIKNVSILPEGEIFTATYGAGIAVQLGRRWIFDTTWMQAPANSSERLPITNFFGAGLIYQFFG